MEYQKLVDLSKKSNNMFYIEEDKTEDITDILISLIKNNKLDEIGKKYVLKYLENNKIQNKKLEQDLKESHRREDEMKGRLIAFEMSCRSYECGKKILRKRIYNLENKIEILSD